MSIESITVESIMTKGVKSINEWQSVKAAAGMMSTYKIGSVIVTKSEDNRPVGIITETDIVHIAGLTEIFLPHILAIDIMSKPVITIDSKGSIQDAIQTMKLNNIRRLPVVDRSAKMVGIITDKDIFKAIINDQSLLSSVTENIAIELRPLYERLNEFMIGEMVFPRGGSIPN